MLDSASILNATAPANQQFQASQLRSADAALRTQLQQIRASAGADSNVTANVTYSVGPDGVRYATGGNVVTSRRTVDNGVERPAEPIQLSPDAPIDAEDAVRTSSALAVRPVTLADVLGNRISLSPLEFAQTFSEDFTDGLRRAELQIADAGVRSQELLHFRAAGGLASGLPQYGTQVGPDGELYATSGQVNIQSTPTTDADKAARDNAVISIAATAPGDASAQDISVARSAISKAASLYRNAAQPEEPQRQPFSINA